MDLKNEFGCWGGDGGCGIWGKGIVRKPGIDSIDIFVNIFLLFYCVCLGALLVARRPWISCQDLSQGVSSRKNVLLLPRWETELVES